MTAAPAGQTARERRRGGTYAGAERLALCDLLDDLGPTAPTLCAGWNSGDLAAHLVLRERRPDAAVGILVKKFWRHTESVRRRILARHPYPQLVELVRCAPAAWAPNRLIPRLDVAMNTLEFFIHHEDLRRAQPGWRPRPITLDHEAALWKGLAGGARFLLRDSPAAVVLASPVGELRAGPARAGATVTVQGLPAELLLFAFGRQSHAQIEYQGEESAVSALRVARFGI